MSFWIPVFLLDRYDFSKLIWSNINLLRIWAQHICAPHIDTQILPRRCRPCLLESQFDLCHSVYLHLDLDLVWLVRCHQNQAGWATINHSGATIWNIAVEVIDGNVSPLLCTIHIEDILRLAVLRVVNTKIGASVSHLDLNWFQDVLLAVRQCSCDDTCKVCNSHRYYAKNIIKWKITL